MSAPEKTNSPRPPASKQGLASSETVQPPSPRPVFSAAISGLVSGFFLGLLLAAVSAIPLVLLMVHILDMVDLGVSSRALAIHSLSICLIFGVLTPPITAFLGMRSAVRKLQARSTAVRKGPLAHSD